MKITNIFMAGALLVAACAQPAPEAEKLTSYVNPLIGSGGHGHVFVGAHVPFGMVQLGPTSVTTTWDWCSGYHQDENSVIGFSHTHLSGTGIGDLFDVTVMPVTGEVTYSRGTLDDEKSGLWSPADRTQEIAKPGYYSVPLTRYGVKAEVTATARVGMHRYTFPAASDAAIVIDLENGGCWDKSTETSMNAEGNTMVTGYRYSTGWAKNQKIYFAAEFSKPFGTFELKGEGNMYGRASFATTDGEELLVKVGGSADIYHIGLPCCKEGIERRIYGNAIVSELLSHLVTSRINDCHYPCIAYFLVGTKMDVTDSAIAYERDLYHIPLLIFRFENQFSLILTYVSFNVK